MSVTESMGSFLKENKKLAREYFETQLEVYKLKMVRIASTSAGYLVWIIVSLFLGFLFFTFIGIVIGFWMSQKTGSYTQGFGIATLIMLVIIVLLAIFRKILFINPIIRGIISRTHGEKSNENYSSEI